MPRPHQALSALRGDAGGELRGLGLLAGGGIPMQCAASRRTIDRANQLTMLARDALRVPVTGRGLEALGQRLYRRAVAQVLEPLTRLDPNALLLLFDVCQEDLEVSSEETPASAGRAMVAGAKRLDVNFTAGPTTRRRIATLPRRPGSSACLGEWSASPGFVVKVSGFAPISRQASL